VSLAIVNDAVVPLTVTLVDPVKPEPLMTTSVPPPP
jgi:hypothetical protein